MGPPEMVWFLATERGSGSVFFTRLNTILQERSILSRQRGSSSLRSSEERGPIFLTLMEISLSLNESQGMPVRLRSLRGVSRLEREFLPLPVRSAFGSILLWLSSFRERDLWER